jgi:hypothetical protein
VKIILKAILKNQHVTMWTGFKWLRIGTSGGLEGLNECQPVKKNFVPWS